MAAVIIWSLIFAVISTISIYFLGSRELISGDITPFRLLQIIFDWRFIVGAIFAFGARLIFVIINNALYQIPELANSSTTITALISAAAMLLVVIMNHFLLGERISVTQGIGGFMVIMGLFLLTRG